MVPEAATHEIAPLPSDADVAAGVAIADAHTAEANAAEATDGQEG